MKLGPSLGRWVTGALLLWLLAGLKPPSQVAVAVSPTLTVNPANAVPNVSAILIGSNFSPVSIAGGTGSAGTHQITGSGDSVITVGGSALSSPYITYPINLDSGGSWFASVIIPANSSTLAASALTFRATDTGGTTASATVALRKRTITLDTTSSRRGTKVKVNGAGFPAANLSSPDTLRVNLQYGTTSLIQVTADALGEFKTDFLVPVTALIPSTNTVTATVAGTNAIATATHSVPPSSITINPEDGPSGIIFTVTGRNLPAFFSVTDLTIGVVSVLPGSATTTDQDGSFTITSLVPQLPPGVHVVATTVGGVRTFTSFKVNEPKLPPTLAVPATATPTPSVAPSLGLEPLINAGNLVRVWHFDPATQDVPPSFGWALFDPRPIFAPANTVQAMVSGQFYWVRVNEGQTVILGGKERVLVGGWNPVTW